MVGTRRGRRDFHELNDFDGRLLMDVEGSGLGVLVHEGCGWGMWGGKSSLHEYGWRAGDHVVVAGTSVEGKPWREKIF